MTTTKPALELGPAGIANRVRDRVAARLGIHEKRKHEIYSELSRSAALGDASYWLQVLFAAGIAAIGLVLDSPAVIIGAMLISPLMGPILAAGLSLAAGDFILGIRSALKLALSCVLAVGFAVVLVGLLPFKEATGEILARTRPNTLDLAVALFSGAIGSLATCKEAKGVVTSIPGVAIAVALMPPLCVVGYGLGVAASLDAAEGLGVARGGGLLFLTNLVAITFTAMLVFLAIHVDTPDVRKQMQEWRAADSESQTVQRRIDAFPGLHRLQGLGTLPGRLIAVGVIILLLLIPLGNSFGELKREILHKQEENRVRRTALTLWSSTLAKMPDGAPRSYLGAISVDDSDGKIALLMNVFTSRPYTDEEKAAYQRMIALELDRPEDAIALQLVEIPTATSELLRPERQAQVVADVPTVAELQARLLGGVRSAMRGLELPPPARLVSYSVATSDEEALGLTLIYLADRDLSDDAKALLVAGARERLGTPLAAVRFDRLQETVGPIAFDRNRADVTPELQEALDAAGQALARCPTLRCEIAAGAEPSERVGVATERAKAVGEYLQATWKLSPERVMVPDGEAQPRVTTVRLTVPEGARAPQARP